ncbi:hypothetical protein D3C76_165380 [compost metagenome]
MLYTLFALTETPFGMMQSVQALHLTEAQCVKQAQYLADELYDGAKCRPEQPTDALTTFYLPSGRVIKLERVNGVYSIPDDLLPNDRRLVDELVSPEPKF